MNEQKVTFEVAKLIGKESRVEGPHTIIPSEVSVVEAGYCKVRWMTAAMPGIRNLRGLNLIAQRMPPTVNASFIGNMSGCQKVRMLTKLDERAGTKKTPTLQTLNLEDLCDEGRGELLHSYPYIHHRVLDLVHDFGLSYAA